MAKRRDIIKFNIDVPIMIPSLKRFTKSKKQKMVIDSCLDNLYRHYNASSVQVLAQEYDEVDVEYLKTKFPEVEFKWLPRRLGIIKTFNKLKDWGCSLGEYYIHYDDDVKMAQQFDSNPTLNALEHVMEMDLDRIGAVTVPSISIHHFTKDSKKFINLHSNPAQLVMINSKAARQCTYDNRFENFRSDTDFTMQMASKKFLPLIISRYFSFMHTIPMSIINLDGGKRTFETLDNVTKTKGSIGGDRRMEKRKIEYDMFSKKWPLVRTHKNYKQQVLKYSIVNISNFQERELVEFDKQFDFSLIKDWYSGYYGVNNPEKEVKNMLFG